MSPRRRTSHRSTAVVTSGSAGSQCCLRRTAARKPAQPAARGGGGEASPATQVAWGPARLKRGRSGSTGPGPVQSGRPAARPGEPAVAGVGMDTGGVRTAALCLPVVVSALSVCCLAPSEFGGLPPLPSDARTLGARTQDWRTLCAIRTGCRADIRHEPA